MVATNNGKMPRIIHEWSDTDHRTCYRAVYVNPCNIVIEKFSTDAMGIAHWATVDNFIAGAGSTVSSSGREGKWFYLLKSLGDFIKDGRVVDE